MKWSWKLGTLAGIGVYVHWTFVILLGWVALVRVQEGGGAADILESLVFVGAAFGCIVLHELGHALTARRFGIATRDITLLPIGGVARLERMPEDPWQEFLVAIAGPAVNVAIAIVLAGVLLVTGSIHTVWQVDLVNGPFLFNLLALNVILVLFNLIPAFPMDGGRVLRALLAKATGNYVAATQTAASVGQAFAILLGIAGLFWLGPFVIFIAFFVYLGAAEESHMVQMRSVFKGVPVRAAMMTNFRSLAPGDPLSRAADELLAGAQQDFPVVDDGRVVGLLERQALVKALAERPRETPVADVMQADCGTVADNEMLQATFDRMQERGCRTLPVVRDGRLVGVVTLENVGELMMIHSALGNPRSTQPAAADRPG